MQETASGCQADRDLQSRLMLLAADIGGTKTLIGLFSPDAQRPATVQTRTYRTLDFPDLGALALDFIRNTGTDIRDITAACFGVAGPVKARRAQLTNVPWIVDLNAMSRQLPIAKTHLLNDLEALAWSVPVLDATEIEVLREGEPDDSGNAALLAAGTGLGVALLPKIAGRFIPQPSEGGHVDFAARTPQEQALQTALIREYGRADVERVVSGPGLANIHRLVHPHQCATLTPMPEPDDLPSRISRAALEADCSDCRRTLEMFVSAYGAAAGNLALIGLATAGVYIGGGIAPRILAALRWPVFLQAFSAKSPMESLMNRIPIKVILNPGAGLIGAATFAKVIL
jgi:glucokinase